MLRKFGVPFACILLVVALINCSAPKTAPKVTLSPAEQVIDDYLNAVGDRAALTGLADVTMEATLTVMGMQVPFTDIRKGNKQVSEAKMGPQVMFRQVFDGEKGVREQMGNKQPYTEKQIARGKESSLVPELSLKERGAVLELDAAAQLDGKTMNKVTMTYPDGRKTEAFFDPTTKLKTQSNLHDMGPDSKPTVQVIKLSDYRDVNGLKFPFALTIEAGPQVMSLAIQKITTNQNVSDDLFKVQ